MEPGADGGLREPDLELGGEPDADRDGALSIGNALRFVEGLMFCVLAALILTWAVDRMRGLGFEPFSVSVCQGAACVDPTESAEASVWQRHAETLDRRGLMAFSGFDRCTFAGDILSTRAEDASARQTLDFMQERGMITITRPDAATAIIAPGANNDGVWDVVRDGLRWQAPRGCYPSNYAPVFWPLWTAWMLLASWRAWRFTRGAGRAA